MNIIKQIRRSFGLKLFISYLAIIVLGTTVMFAAAQSIAPAAFSRHMAGMMDMPDGSHGMEMLFGDFRLALAEAVFATAAVSVAAAVIVSYFVSRRILHPVTEMMAVSKEMAAAKYGRRVPVEGEDELAVLAANFNSMAEALGHTEERRQQMIADVAHELRTPLTTIKSHMEALLDGVLPPEPGTFHLVHREADRLARLVEDLQELSRAEARHLNLRLEPVEVHALAAAAASRLNPQYQEKGVSLEVSVPDHLPRVRADEDRIIQVLLNLLGNALRYTPADGRVSITARKHGGEVQVSVGDTGVGLAPEDLSRVFERFYRVDRSRSRAGGGSGLGLTISKHIVEAHGGRIWAESPGPGKGSTLHFTLPVATGAISQPRGS